MRIAFCVPTFLSKPDDEPPMWRKGKTLNLVVDSRSMHLVSLFDYLGNEVKWGSKQMVPMLFKAIKIEDFHGPLTFIPSPEKPSNCKRTKKGTPDVGSYGIPCTPPARDAAPPDAQTKTTTAEGAKGEAKADAEEVEESDADSIEVHSDRSCHTSGESSDSGYEPDSAYEPDEGDDEIGEDKSDYTDYAFNYENPCVDKGTIFSDAATFTKVLRHHSLINDYQYQTEKSSLDRVRVHCKAKECKWRIHASKTSDKRYFKVKINDVGHTCSSVNKCDDKMATSPWVADRVIDWLKTNPHLGPKELQTKIEEHFHIESYPMLYAFKEEIQRKMPGSIVDIDTEVVDGKVCFRRIFVALKLCIDGFLQGCRSYLAIDSTHLIGRQRGQLAAACAIDGYNFIYLVAYGVFEPESIDNWEWFINNLKKAVGEPNGLVVSTDARKGITKGVNNVYPHVEHIECFRHLFKNFRKKFKGGDYERHMWPLGLSYTEEAYHKHWPFIARHANAVKFLAENHSLLWSRSKFSTYSKVDYVNNNLSKSFNTWIKKYKMLNIVDLMDKIRELIMKKFDHRRGLCEKFDTEKIVIPSVLKKLTALTRAIATYSGVRSSSILGEVRYRDSQGNPDRDVVNLHDKTCTCGKWQLIGIPCLHAIAFIVTIRQYKMEDYVHEFYSIERFRKAYEGILYPMTDKSEWPAIDPGFVLRPLLVRRQPGRPRADRIKGSDEPSSKRKHKCSRCDQLGHHYPKCTRGLASDQSSKSSSNDPTATPGLPAPKKSKKDSSTQSSTAASNKGKRRKEGTKKGKTQVKVLEKEAASI
ncbi:uncharacterized protein LOC133906007 [Phragmites australis]|uniref:uncharacterized protein LOC133906007 n=1 Tax=Phragmites australis TaxID=29695 RepID=UPI002D76B742|nr:uncharacterized protein LOC133906007 [Phragmites australis]